MLSSRWVNPGWNCKCPNLLGRYLSTHNTIIFMKNNPMPLMQLIPQRRNKTRARHLEKPDDSRHHAQDLDVLVCHLCKDKNCLQALEMLFRMWNQSHISSIDSTSPWRPRRALQLKTCLFPRPIDMRDLEEIQTRDTRRLCRTFLSWRHSGQESVVKALASERDSSGPRHPYLLTSSDQDSWDTLTKFSLKTCRSTFPCRQQNKELSIGVKKPR